MAIRIGLQEIDWARVADDAAYRQQVLDRLEPDRSLLAQQLKQQIAVFTEQYLS